MTNYPASDEFESWLGNLSGMPTRIETEYGAISELVERPNWDDGRTLHAVRLIKALHVHIRAEDVVDWALKEGSGEFAHRRGFRYDAGCVRVWVVFVVGHANILAALGPARQNSQIQSEPLP